MYSFGQSTLALLPRGGDPLLDEAKDFILLELESALVQGYPPHGISIYIPYLDTCG
jgi:hypothetical protein